MDVNSFVTDNTPVSDWLYEHADEHDDEQADDFTVYVVPQDFLIIMTYFLKKCFLVTYGSN